MFVLPVSLSAWYGGFRPGLFATLVSAVVAEVFFVRPYLQVKIDAGVDAVHFILFLFVGGLISWLSEKRLVEALAAKKSGELLNETGQHLEAMVQASPLAIMVVNQKAEVQLWNPAAERIFGWRADGSHWTPDPDRSERAPRQLSRQFSKDACTWRGRRSEGN